MKQTRWLSMDVVEAIEREPRDGEAPVERIEVRRVRVVK